MSIAELGMVGGIFEKKKSSITAYTKTYNKLIASRKTYREIIMAEK